jgi:DNA repair exonuclease SbcCD ATPase subunit
MLLKKLRLHNYCSYVDRTFEFGRGLTVITGKNGIGKSSLLNAIFFALTGGSIIDGKTRPKMLKWNTDRGCIELTVDMGGISYFIRRNLHTGSARMEWMEAGSAKVLTTTPEINSKMQGLLGADEDTLALSSFMAQKGAMTLIFGSDMERQKEFSRLFKLIHLQKHREFLKEIWNGIEVYPDFTSEIGSLEKRLLDINLKTFSMTSTLDTIQKEIVAKKGQYDELKKAPAPDPVEIDLYSKWQRREKVLQDLETIQAQVSGIVEPTMPVWNKDKELQDSNMDFLELNKKIKLAEQKKCPTCGSDVGVSDELLSEMRVTEGSIRRKIDQLSKEWSKFKTDKAQYEKDLRAYQSVCDQSSRIISEVHDLSTMVEKFNLEDFLAKRDRKLTEEQVKFIQTYDHLVAHERMLNSELVSLQTSKQLYEGQLSEKRGYMELRSLGEEQRVLVEEIRKVLHVDCFPKEVISACRPKLTRAINKYLSIFRQPFYVDINQDLAIVCKFADNPNASVQELSGGQGVLLVICFRMAIVELLASSTNIIVLDEPTPHLDSDNRAILVEAFVKVKEYLATHNIQMIVSTHELELLSVADNEIKIGG